MTIMMKASNRSLRLIFSHICAFAVGALLMLQYNFLIVLDNDQQKQQQQRSSSIIVTTGDDHNNDPSKTTTATMASRRRTVVECNDSTTTKQISSSSSSSSSSNSNMRKILELSSSLSKKHHDEEEDDGNDAKNSLQSSSSSSQQQKQKQKKRKQQQKYDLLPIIILENVPMKNAHNLQKLLLDSKLRISLPLPRNNENSTASPVPTIIGPYYGFYPSNKQNEMNNWISNLQRTTTPTLLQGNNTFIKYEMVDNTKSKREIFYSLEFWKYLQQITKKVLILDYASVLCGTPTYPILSYLHYDWIGAAWKWASNPKSPHHYGGNGAYSIRNPKHLVTILEEQKITKETMPNSNEDMWFVRYLNEWMIKGDIRRGNNIVEPPKLAPYNIQQEFAVEEIVSPTHITPTGVYHLMRTVDYKDRDQLIQKCPEIKSLFTPLHEAKCSLIRCPKNMSINYWVMKDLEKQEGKKEGSLVEKCDIHYHPVAESILNNWTIIPSPT